MSYLIVLQGGVGSAVQVQVVDPSALDRIRVPPPPLPASWGRSVAPYCPAHARGQPSVYDALFHAPLPPTPPQASGDVANDDGPRSPAAPTAIHTGAGTPARQAFSRQYQAGGCLWRHSDRDCACKHQVSMPAVLTFSRFKQPLCTQDGAGMFSLHAMPISVPDRDG